MYLNLQIKTITNRYLSFTELEKQSKFGVYGIGFEIL